MSNDDRIRVLIAHNNPLVAAGLEAAFSTQQDFHIVGCRDTDDASLLDAAAVAVTVFGAVTGSSVGATGKIVWVWRQSLYRSETMMWKTHWWRSSSGSTKPSAFR